MTTLGLRLNRSRLKAEYPSLRDKREHIVLAEKAAGHALPRGAEVHHVNEDKHDNRHGEDGVFNLVVCQDRAYHGLLHQRQRALAACGNAAWRKCMYCEKYDAPGKLKVRPRRGAYHRECENARARAERKATA